MSKTSDVNNEIIKNVLLLGETGVGKTTFINAVANYLKFNNIEHAEREGPFVLIQSTITMLDGMQERTITVGETDDNECQIIGKSCTQNVKTYDFQLSENDILRLIDTPGIGDTDDIKYDEMNYNNIFNYLKSIKIFNAVCILIKPNQTRITPFLRYCFQEIFSRLEKSVHNNIIFVFTNTRPSNYASDDSLQILTNIICEVYGENPLVKVTLFNTFYFDNEAFRYLMAIKNKLQIDEQDKLIYKESWNKSSVAFNNMFQYIKKLMPLNTEQTYIINEARKMFLQLCKPTIDVGNFIHNNITQMKNEVENLPNDDTEHKFNIITMTTTIQSSQVMVCLQCESINRKSICHKNCLAKCTLSVIGYPDLQKCELFEDRNCKICRCSYSVHICDRYIKEIQVTQKSMSRSAIKTEIDKIESEYQIEYDSILKALVTFANLLRNHALLPYNDAYERYLIFSQTNDEHLRYLLDQYRRQVEIFQEALEISDENGHLRGTDVVVDYLALNVLKGLIKLKYSKNMFNQILSYNVNEFSSRLQ